MFDKLRNALSSAAKSFGQKELKEKDIDGVLFELEVALMESDVATEVIDSLKADLKKKLIGATVEKEKIVGIVKQTLRQNISNLFENTKKIDILSNIKKKKEAGEPYIILFMGINGTGKTTTIAKVGYLLQQNKLSVVIAAADTYRAGAIEQLSEHARRLNLKIIAQNYGSDPAAVARDAELYAKSHKINCILIDTAGRMQTSKNLMDQISKINKVVNPDLKLFVGDALAGNDTVNQAREFYQYTKFDGAILTKSDADARGGAAISIVKVTSTPILYLGMGQEYKDLTPFDKESFLDSIFGLEEIPLGQIQKSEIKSEDSEQNTSYHVEELDEAVIAETKFSQKSVSQAANGNDPFSGIETKDIQKYSQLFDISPPENDTEARELASKIRAWILKGRPTSIGEASKKHQEDSLEQKDVKPKKKRSIFGWRSK